MSDNFENHRLRTMMWIVNTLDRHPEGLSLKELNKLWLSNIDLSRGIELGRRTFTNYKQAIFDLFEVLIECDMRDRFRYKIVVRDDQSKINQWLLRSFTINEAVSANKSLSNRIVLEDIPSGTEFLEPLLDALRTNCKVTFSYRRFEESAPHKVKGADPYCLKIYHQRWYLLVKEYRTLLVSHEKVEEMHIYALDRMSDLELLPESFEMDPLFDAQEYFKYAFGTRVEKGNPPCKVKLKVASGQANYLRTLPLHHSQRETERNSEYSIFELDVALTIELYLQILHYGSRIEVLEPDDLYMIIRNEVINMALLYEIIEPLTEEEREAALKDIEDNPEEYNRKYPRDLYQGMFGN